MSGGGWHHKGAFKEKLCRVCNKPFTPFSGAHIFCSDECRSKWKYISGKETTASQYAKISGNWRAYYNRLANGRGRVLLPVSELLGMHDKQGGLCARTGVPMTCILEKNVQTWTNASIDRINPGGIYDRNNCQLVCRAVNLFRGNVPLGEFIEWCRRVADYNPRG